MQKFTLRCFAKKTKHETWEAYCLDFSLAAKGDTLEQAKNNLHEQVKEYVYDALVGEDREHADNLLYRRAPLSLWTEYHTVRTLLKLISLFTENSDNHGYRPYSDPLPMKPA